MVKLLVFSILPLYLDPGSGSIILQLILAALLGMGVVLRMFWKRIKGFIVKGENGLQEIDDEPYGPND